MQKEDPVFPVVSLFNLEDDRDGTAEKIEQLATKSKGELI